MRLPCKFVLCFLLFCLSYSSNEISASTDSREEVTGLRVFSYESLNSARAEMMADFRDHGFIAISGVPGFVEAYDRFIAAAREFTALPAEIQAECTPADSFGRG